MEFDRPHSPPSEVAASRQAPPAGRILGEALGWAAGLSAGLGLLLSCFGSSLADFYRYAAYVLGYALVPGVVVYALGVTRPRSVIAFFSQAWVLGIAIEMAVYFLCLVLNVHRHAFPFFPLIFIAIGVHRRHVIAKRLQTLGPVSTREYALLSVTLLLLVFMAALFLFTPVLDPHFAFQIGFAKAGLVGYPLRDPFDLSSTLFYHYLFYLHLAGAHIVTGLSIIDLGTRLSLTVYFIPLVLVLYSTCRDRFGIRYLSVLVPVQAFALMGYTPILSGWFAHALMPAMLLVSPTMAGLFFYFALLFEIPDWLDDRAAAMRKGQLAVILFLMLVSSGVRSAVLPVLGASLGFLAVVEIVFRRRWPSRVLLLLAGAIGAFVVGLFLFYGFGSSGNATEALVVSGPLESVRHRPPYQWMAAHHWPVPVAAVVAYLVILLGRQTFLLPGIMAMAFFWKRKIPAPDRLLLLGTWLVGAVFVFLFSAPGGTQYTFTHYGHLAASIFGVAGLSRIAQQANRPAFVLPIVWLAVAGLATVHVADLVPAFRSDVASLPERDKRPRFAPDAATEELFGALRALGDSGAVIALAVSNSQVELFRTVPAEVETVRLFGSILSHAAQRPSAPTLTKLRRNLVLSLVRPDQSIDPAILAQMRQLIGPDQRLYLVKEVSMPSPGLDRPATVFRNAKFEIVATP